MEESGAAIKKIRKKRGLSLQTLAKGTGLSAGFISKIERGETSPSFNNLQKICHFLNISADDLIAKQPFPQKEQYLIRTQDRRLIYDYSNIVRFESLFSNKSSISVNVLTIRSDNEYSSTQHQYDEIGIIARGALLIQMDGNEYILNEGDCIFIKAHTLHHVQKRSDGDCISYWIVPNGEISF